jgi:hypothetical protein
MVSLASRETSFGFQNSSVSSLNALEQRADLFLFSAGKASVSMGIDADVLWNHWHSLGVIVHDHHFAVSLDQKPPFTAFDRTRMKDGRVGLRTQEGYPF